MNMQRICCASGRHSREGGNPVIQIPGLLLSQGRRESERARKPFFLFLLVVPFFFTHIASAAPAPAGLDKIAAYAGDWEGETQNFATPFSKASHEIARIHNDAWRSGDFYVIHQVVNGKPAPVLSVYTYDAKADVYHVYGIPEGGDDPGPAGKLIIKGNVWTFPWEYHDKGKTVYFRVVNVFTTPKTIEYRQEFSTDRQHWTLLAKGNEVKIR